MSQDIFIIKYQTENPEKLIDIKLNNSSTSTLECEDKNGFKECIVPKSYFNESGYYYTQYNNTLGARVNAYEIPKIQVIFKKEDNSKSNKNLVGIIVGSKVGGLALIASIVIIIIFVKKRKANNSSVNISKSSNILPNSAQLELIEGEKFGNE